jgi:class 3 adenylate cyclase
MEPVLTLADVARWAGESVDRVHDWWTAGLLGGGDGEHFGSVDLGRAKMLALLAPRGVATDHRVVKQIGDAFMLTFGVASSAVAATLDIDRRASLEPRFPPFVPAPFGGRGSDR